MGEVHGAEDWDLLEVLETGDGGSISTIHANPAEDALMRLGSHVLPAASFKKRYSPSMRILKMG